MKMKQQPRLRISQTRLWVGIGSLTLVLAFVGFFNFSRIDHTRAEIKTELKWIGGKSDKWNSPTNWSPSQIPDKNTKVIFSGSESIFTLNKNDQFEIGELVLESGATIQVKGHLQIANDLLINGLGSKLILEGTMNCAFDINMLNLAKLTIEKNAELEIGASLTLENALVENLGGKVAIAQDLGLRRQASSFLQNEGTLTIAQDLVLATSPAAANIFEMNGGTTTVGRNTAFIGELETAKTKAQVAVNGGKMLINYLARNEFHPYQLPETYSFKIQGGQLVFNQTIYFDTLKTTTPLLGEGLVVWKLDQNYKRSHENELVAVQYKGKVYWLKDSKWNSTGDIPGSSTVWVEKGAVADVDQTKNCANILDWEKTKTYTQKAGEDLFVNYKGSIYRMNKTSSISKGNEPDKNDWAWVKWHTCQKNELFYDMLKASSGEIVFNGAFYRRPGLMLDGNSTLTVASTEFPFVFNEGDKIANLGIAKNAQLYLKGDVTLSGNITNASEVAILGKGKLSLTGENNQVVSGSAALNIQHLEIDKDSGSFVLAQALHIYDSLVWKKPLAIQQAEANRKTANQGGYILTFHSNAAFAGNGWYTGKVRKIGSDAFLFPTGSLEKAGYFGLSSSSDSTSYTVQYIKGSAPNYAHLSSSVSHISAKEYWVLSCEYGSENLVPTAYWNNAIWSNIDKPEDLVLSAYNGKQWISLGNRFYKSEAGQGSITSLKAVENNVYFTFGSVSVANPLSDDNFPFSVSKRNNSVEILWQYKPDGLTNFTLLGGSDSSNLAPLKGFEMENGQMSYLANSTSAQVYFAIDATFENGMKKRYNNLKTELETSEISAISVFPNPFQSRFTLKFESENRQQGFWQISNLQGQVLYVQNIAIEQGTNHFEYTDKLDLPLGVYQVSVAVGNKKLSAQVSKN